MYWQNWNCGLLEISDRQQDKTPVFIWWDRLKLVYGSNTHRTETVAYLRYLTGSKTRHLYSFDGTVSNLCMAATLTELQLVWFSLKKMQHLMIYAIISNQCDPVGVAESQWMCQENCTWFPGTGHSSKKRTLSYKDLKRTFQAYTCNFVRIFSLLYNNLILYIIS